MNTPTSTPLEEKAIHLIERERPLLARELEKKLGYALPEAAIDRSMNLMIGAVRENQGEPAEIIAKAIGSAYNYSLLVLKIEFPKGR